MSDLVPIGELTIDDIQRVVRAALPGGRLQPEVIDDFVASVDWSDFDESQQSTAPTALSQIESWASAFAERDLDALAYVVSLMSVLAEESGDNDPMFSLTLTGTGNADVWAAIKTTRVASENRQLPSPV